MKQHRFDKRGVLAMRADFWGMFFGATEEEEDFELRGDVAIVSIEGPLTQHDTWWCDSYDSIRERVAAALDSSASTILLRIDSPGGECAGCFETARALHDMAEKASKRLVAYADGQATSAGYALACAAGEIYLPATAFVGSIGVINTLMDWVAMNERMGLNLAVVASGTRKRYGHPDVPLTEAAVETAQKQVDQLADLFFAFVAERRPLSVDELRAMQAGVVIGADAVSAKLADSVTTLDTLLETLSSGGPATPPRAEGTTMAWKDDMKKAAEDGDEDAKKCLDALDDGDAPEPEKKKEGAEEEAPPSEKKEKKDGDDEKEKTEEPEKKDEAAARGLRPVAGGTVEQRLAAMEEREERDQLLGSRADLPKDLRKKLAAAPIETVRWTIDNLPKVAAAKIDPQKSATTTKTSPLAHANATVPGATRAAHEGDDGLSRRSEHADELDVRMGLAARGSAIRHEGNRLVLGVMTPAQARAEMARREKEMSK